jgi:hypothetical protein
MVFAGVMKVRLIDKNPDFLAKDCKSSKVLKNGSIFIDQ